MKVNNKATRLNRAMMYGTLFLGILVIGTAFGFMYYSFDIQKQNNEAAALGDSLVIEVNDSTFFD